MLQGEAWNGYTITWAVGHDGSDRCSSTNTNPNVVVKTMGMGEVSLGK